MKKIPTLFRRDPANMQNVLTEVHPNCQWVLDGEGVATAKIDGTCVMLTHEGEWWARREVKPDAAAPRRYLPVQHDHVTGKTVGWEPVEQSAFAKFHRQALAAAERVGLLLSPGTFELCGPKINKNPVGLPEHRLIRHGSTVLPNAARDYDSLRALLTDPGFEYEGIVWWREPGNADAGLAKLKVRDFPRVAAHA